jgi:hypothetical protein
MLALAWKGSRGHVSTFCGIHEYEHVFTHKWKRRGKIHRRQHGIYTFYYSNLRVSSQSTFISTGHNHIPIPLITPLHRPLI